MKRLPLVYILISGVAFAQSVQLLHNRDVPKGSIGVKKVTVTIDCDKDIEPALVLTNGENRLITYTFQVTNKTGDKKIPNPCQTELGVAQPASPASVRNPPVLAEVGSWSDIAPNANKALYSVNLGQNQMAEIRRKSGSGRAVLTVKIFSLPYDNPWKKIIVERPPS